MLWILSLQNVLRCSLALDETVASSRLKKDWSAFPVIKWQFSFCAHPDKKSRSSLSRTQSWIKEDPGMTWEKRIVSMADIFVWFPLFASLLFWDWAFEKSSGYCSYISLSFARLEARILEDKVFCHFRVTQFFSGQSSFILCILSLSHSEIILFSVKHFSKKKRFKVERQPLRQFLHLGLFCGDQQRSRAV